MTNDVISITVDYDSKKMTFKKKNEKYELDFTTIPGDPLYPCALFYYMNDEVEFLPNYKEWLTSFDLLLHYLFIVIILFFHFLFSWARIFLNINAPNTQAYGPAKCTHAFFSFIFSFLTQATWCIPNSSHKASASLTGPM